MPSWVSSVPIHEVSELASLTIQRKKQSLATPSSVEAEAEDEVELKLDFQGFKHIATSKNSDETYTLQDDIFSSYTTFTMPGQATANALRHYLQEHLQLHQITDEYGDQCDLTCISNNHLSVLQAKMWSKASKGRSPMKPTILRPSRTQVLVADHVAKIMHHLEEKHIFVLSNTESGTCQYLNDLRKTVDHICTSEIVTLEPLIHWGTVTPAIMSPGMITFRRDGGLMQIPAYKQLVKRSINSEAPSYCVDCLRYLWGKRTEAQSILRQLNDNHLRLQLPESNWKNQISTLQPVKNLGSTRLDVITTDTGRVVRPTAYQSNPAGPKIHKRISTISQDFPSPDVQMKPTKLQSSFQFDGSSDYLGIARSPSRSDNHQSHSSTWEGPDGEENTNERVQCISSSCSDSSTYPFRMASVMPKGLGGSSTFARQQTLKKVPTPTSTQDNNTAKENLQLNRTFVKNKYGFRVKVQTTPPCHKERKFGRELDTNSKATPVRVKRSSQEVIKQVSIVEKKPPVIPVQPMTPVKPLRPLRRSNNPLKIIKRKNYIRDGQAIKQKKAYTTDPRDHSPTPLGYQINSTAGLRLTTESHSMSSSPSPPRLTVHFAKRTSNSNILEGVVTMTYEAFQNMHPSPSSKICVCNKSASHGTFKKGEIPQISQCVNRDCRFRWYHYACLNQSEKGKARWGTLICQHCRNEEELTEKYKKDDRSLVQQMKFRREWSKEDIEAGMPGLGGHSPVVNPYGLGVKIDLSPLYKTETCAKEKLGDMESFGYAQSRPHILQKAYANPDAYADVWAATANDEAKDNQWWCGTHTTEENYSDDEEPLDPDMEEEL